MTNTPDPQWLIDYLQQCRQFFSQSIPQLPWCPERWTAAPAPDTIRHRIWRVRNQPQINSYQRAYYRGYTVQKGKTS